MNICISLTLNTRHQEQRMKEFKHLYFAIFHPLHYLSVFIYHKIITKSFTFFTIIVLRNTLKMYDFINIDSKK